MKINHKVKMFAMGVLMVASAAAAALPASAALKLYCHDGTQVSKITECPEYDGVANTDTDLGATVTGLINVILGIVGFLAVLMIIFGGITYTTSAGDPGKVKKAKDTIMYGLIGLVVAVLAFAIVNFVLANVGQETS